MVPHTKSHPRGQVVARYATYDQAQRAVDHLSDASFPVEYSSIVGRDLSLVEQVTGRMTKARATLMGAGSGAWFGLFIGLFVGLFTIGPVWITLVIAGLVIGAVWGGAFGLAAQWATRGERDFASASAIVAAQYEVTVADPYDDRARQLLSQRLSPSPGCGGRPPAFSYDSGSPRRSAFRAGRARHLERPPSAPPVPEAGDARTAGRISTANSVVADGHPEHPVLIFERDVDLARSGVLRGVGQGFRHDVVARRLYPFGQRRLRVDLDADRDD